MAAAAIWDAVSLGVLLAWAAPLAGLALTRDPAYLLMAAGLVGCEVTTRALQALPVPMHPPGHPRARPLAARDCNGFNGGGSYRGRNGMPSGHVTVVAFASLTALAIECAGGRLPATRMWWGVAGCIAAVAAVAASRLARHCHTTAQVLAGAALGTALAAVAALALALARALARRGS